MNDTENLFMFVQPYSPIHITHSANFATIAKAIGKWEWEYATYLPERSIYDAAAGCVLRKCDFFYSIFG